MSKNIWFISDTHFQHKNIALVFTGEDGKRVRNFDSVEEMNELMIRNWNDRVGSLDIVYHLGDVFFGNAKTADVILSRLNGKKKLIIGNHDYLNDSKTFTILQKHFSIEFFDRMNDPVKNENFFMAHVPFHPSQFGKYKYQVHGHIHEKVIDDPNYINICVEHTNYSPVSYQELKERMK